MTKIIDLFTRQPSLAAIRTPEELASYARAHAGPDFEKRRGVMVITSETQAATDELLEMFALGIRSSDDPRRQINTWGWICAPVARCLEWYGTEYFEDLVRPLNVPEFVDYVVALATGDRAGASDAARRLDVYDGVGSEHPQARRLTI